VQVSQCQVGKPRRARESGTSAREGAMATVDLRAAVRETLE